MKKFVFFHVRYVDVVHHVEGLLDMMRYDSAEVLQPITDEVEWLTLTNDGGPTTARWHSFHIAVRETVDPRFSISKRPKAEVYALVPRESIGLFDRHDRDEKWFRSFIGVLAADRAIPCSNAPTGFYLFKFASHAPKFDKWRALGCPIHAAYLSKNQYPPGNVYEAAKRPAVVLDTVIPAMY